MKARELKLGENLSLPLSVVTEKLAILAQSGAGKSYTAMRIAELMLDAGAQVVAVDPVGIWWSLRSPVGDHPAPQIVIFGGAHQDLPLPPSSGKAVAELLATRGVSAVLDTSEMTDEDMARFLADFAGAFFHAKKRHPSPVHIFWEESQLIIPETPEIRGAVEMKSQCIRLIRLGRNYGVGGSMITQQPQDTSKRGLNQAGTLIILRMVGENERKDVLKRVSAKLSREEVNSLRGLLPELETGEAFIWSPSFLKKTATVKISRRWTFDSSKTPEVGAKTGHPKSLAPVELAEIRQLLTAAGAEVEGDDPELLHQRIAALGRELAQARRAVELAQKSAPPPAPPVDAGAVEVLRADVEAMGRAFLEIAQHGQELSTKAFLLSQPVSGRIAKLFSRATPAPAVVPSPSRSSTPRNTGAPAHSQISRGARRLLVTLFLAPGGELDKVELGVRTVYAYSSGNFTNLLSELRGAGLIDPAARGGRIRLTAQGEDAAAELSGDEPALTSEMTIARWREKLGATARRIFGVLVHQYPAALTREEIAIRASYSAGSGNFTNALGELNGPGLLEKSGKGATATFRAPAFLFPASSGANS